MHSRPFDDGSGRMVYFGHGTEHFSHVIQLEGAIASNYQDAQVTYVAMGADMIDDVQVKTGGVDASAPMGTGLNINVITKSGGNVFKGSGAYAYQPATWNGNNTNNCSASASCRPATAAAGGTPTTAIVQQFDGGLGGPIVRDKVWSFGSLRRANLESGISRTADNVKYLRMFYPNAIRHHPGGQLHDRGGAVVGRGCRPAAGRRSAARRVRAGRRRLVDRFAPEQPARDADALRVARRGPGARAGRQNARYEDRQEDPAGRHAVGGACGKYLQPDERRQLHAVQLQPKPGRGCRRSTISAR